MKPAASSLLLASLLTFSLVACKKAAATDTTTTKPTDTAATKPSAPAAAAVTTPGAIPSGYTLVPPVSSNSPIAAARPVATGATSGATAVIVS